MNSEMAYCKASVLWATSHLIFILTNGNLQLRQISSRHSNTHLPLYKAIFDLASSNHLVKMLLEITFFFFSGSAINVDSDKSLKKIDLKLANVPFWVV